MPGAAKAEAVAKPDLLTRLQYPPPPATGIKGFLTRLSLGRNDQWDVLPDPRVHREWYEAEIARMRLPERPIILPRPQRKWYQRKDILWALAPVVGYFGFGSLLSTDHSHDAPEEKEEYVKAPEDRNHLL